MDEGAAEAEKRRVRDQLAKAGRDLPELKRLAERLFWLNLTSPMRSRWCCLDGTEGRLERRTSVSLGLLRLNDVALLAFPGETFRQTGEAAVGRNADHVMTVTEHGRTALYMPPPDDWGRGGYESSCTAIARDAEPLLRRKAADFLLRHLP